MVINLSMTFSTELSELQLHSLVHSQLSNDKATQFWLEHLEGEQMNLRQRPLVRQVTFLSLGLPNLHICQEPTVDTAIAPFCQDDNINLWVLYLSQ